MFVWIASHWVIWLVVMVVSGIFAIVNQLLQVKNLGRAAADGGRGFMFGLGRMALIGIVAWLSMVLLIISGVFYLIQQATQHS